MKRSYLDHHKDIPLTLDGQLKRCASLYGDRQAISDSRFSLNWREVDALVTHLAYKLLERSAKRGDRILISMERRIEIVLAFLAVARLGAVSVPLNFKVSRDERQQVIDLVKPVGGLYHSHIYEMVSPLETAGWSICLDDAPFIEMIKNPSSVISDQNENQLFSIDPDAPAYLNMTSGSTGIPKAAVATNRQLTENTRACVDKFEMNENDIHLPLFAVMAHPHEIFCRALMTGASIVLLENLYPRTIAETIDKCRVTCIMAVASVYNLLIPFLAEKKYNVSSLRLPESGGMVTSPSLIDRFQEVAGVPIIPVWGSTESMGVAFSSELDGSSPKDSVGKPLPGYTAKIVNSQGKELPPGNTGEMFLKGPGIMTGYWNNEKLTSEVLKDYWYHSGDLFEKDHEGNFYYRGRLDAMMKVSGLKIFPAEIEAAIFSHPSVRDAVVVPYDQQGRGIVPMALIVTEPGEVLGESQLRRFLLTKLSVNKIPKIIRFLPDLPRTSNGKIDRQNLSFFADSKQKPSIDSLERRLEAIDLKILHLLNERMRIENAIQRDQRKAAFQPERIQEIIDKLVEFNPGPLHDSVVEELFNKILSLGIL
ncbi:MAG: AMP-binding protein [bacterium]